ncbi:MAG: hypothetical protein SO022_12500 [Selenomonadaceae bacterium]|nr:hypothetical protein [Selenomonadaceae bacterium]
MFSSMIEKYNKEKLKLVQDLVGDGMLFYDETTFISDEEISVRISNLQEEYGAITKEVEFLQQYGKKDQDTKTRLSYLANKARDIREMIAFWASNSKLNLNYCASLLENNNSRFQMCISAIKDFYNDKHKDAFQKINQFLLDGGDFYKHYLLNKIFGILLCEIHRYEKAEKFILRAIKLRPDDVQLHEILCNVYEKTNCKDKQALEERISMLLKD